MFHYPRTPNEKFVRDMAWPSLRVENMKAEYEYLCNGNVHLPPLLQSPSTLRQIIVGRAYRNIQVREKKELLDAELPE